MKERGRWSAGFVLVGEKTMEQNGLERHSVDSSSEIVHDGTFHWFENNRGLSLAHTEVSVVDVEGDTDSASVVVVVGSIVEQRHKACCSYFGGRDLEACGRLLQGMYNTEDASEVKHFGDIEVRCQMRDRGLVMSMGAGMLGEDALGMGVGNYGTTQGPYSASDYS